MKVYAAICLAIFVCTTASAGDHHAPLPAKIAAAKMAFIDNQTGFEEAGDHCYEAFQKWGRYQLVNDRSKADLIIMLSGGREKHGAVAHSGWKFRHRD